MVTLQSGSGERFLLPNRLHINKKHINFNLLFMKFISDNGCDFS
jgi:hypothetical protein